jgi:hypothetical protein
MSLAEKLLATATHPTTPDAEALSAARKLGNLIGRHGGVVASAFGLAPARVFVRASSCPSTRSGSFIRSFKQARRGRTSGRGIGARTDQGPRQIEEQDERIDRSRSGRRRAKDSMTFIDFANRAKVILGISSGWVQEFCRQTGISENILTNARCQRPSAEIVGRNAAQAEDGQEAAPKPAGPLAFTIKEVQHPQMGRDDGRRRIRRSASQEFGRIITEGHIHKLRSNLRNRSGGYTDPAYGGALPTIAGATARGGASSTGASFRSLNFTSAESSSAVQAPLRWRARPASETGYDISGQSGHAARL